MAAPAEIPAYHELLWPALLAVEELGGSASISEMEETVVKQEHFTDDQLSVLHNEGPQTEIGYRLAWARTYLKGMGLLGVETTIRTVEEVNIDSSYFSDL